jgi:hypothetical protein
LRTVTECLYALCHNHRMANTVEPPCQAGYPVSHVEEFAPPSAIPGGR